jgi:glycosyltransferase involved in cell wall biosynthesis
MRPRPENYREVDYNDFEAEDYDVLILQDQEHLMSPLACAKIPRIFIQHNPPSFPPPSCHPVNDPDITVVFVSEYVRQSWSLITRVKGVTIETGIPDEFYPWTGAEEAVITVVNHFIERDKVTGYTLWRILTKGLSSKVIGDGDPTLGKPARDFDDLRREYSANRVYLNTTVAPGMAMREALLTGMPVITRVEDFPFENEVEIFKSSNLKKMREYLELCLKDHDVAKRVGESGRKKALELFSIDLFTDKWEKLLETVSRNKS